MNETVNKFNLLIVFVLIIILFQIFGLKKMINENIAQTMECTYAANSAKIFASDAADNASDAADNASDAADNASDAYSSASEAADFASNCPGN